MIENKLLIHFTQSDLRKMIQEEVKKALVISGLTNKREIALSRELLTRKDVANLFRITLPTVEKWRSAEILPAPIKRGGRVYYLRSQIEKILIEKEGGNGDGER